MGQYKGKREASRHTGEPQQRIPQPMGDPFTEPDPIPSDPFAQPSLQDHWHLFFDNARWFFRSRRGKVITSVVCALLVLGIGAAAAVKSWVKPPELPAVEGTENVQSPVLDADKLPSENVSQNETDDDAQYPDDGYTGEMPSVSGERKEGVYTFLLVGTDKDDGNTDTIMVASYDTIHQTVNIMSIPRDTMINESWDIKKINSVYAHTGGNLTSLATRVKRLIGFQPDFYLKVELSVFVELVDLVGGIDFYVPQDMYYSDPYQNLFINLKQGQQTLDGEKAMQLVRFRSYSEGDIKRVEVQQSFMKALIQECLSVKHWGKVKAYIDLAMEHIQTDLSLGNVVWFASNVLGLNTAPVLDMDDVYTCTLPGDYWGSAWSRTTNSNQSYVTLYANQTVTLVNERFNPYVQNVTTGMLDVMRILDNGDIASSTGTLRDTTHNAVMAVRRGEAYYDQNGKLVYGTVSTPSEDTPAANTEPDPPSHNDDTPSVPPSNTNTPSSDSTDSPPVANGDDAPNEGDTPPAANEEELPAEGDAPPSDSEGDTANEEDIPPPVNDGDTTDEGNTPPSANEDDTPHEGDTPPSTDEDGTPNEDTSLPSPEEEPQLPDEEPALPDTSEEDTL